jgi:ubiquinone/menaquinone biosynthesis C-methylase UbiE
MFVGTAKYYAKYRPSYDNSLISTILERAGSTEVLLDLGCGTGQLAIPLSLSFSRTLAVDPDSNMLVEGEKAAIASRDDKQNIEWIEGSSKDLEQILDTVDALSAVTMGRAFHWMDREAVLKVLREKLEDGGSIFLIGEISKGISPANWRDIAKEVITKYLGEERKAGEKGRYEHPKKKHEEVIAESEFGQPEIVHFEVTRHWNVESIIGFLYSTSFCSIPVLADKRKAFEGELRERLIKASPTGNFEEQVTEELIIATK